GFDVQRRGFIEMVAADKVHRGQLLFVRMLEMGAQAGEGVGGFADIGPACGLITEDIHQWPMVGGMGVGLYGRQVAGRKPILRDMDPIRPAHSSLYFFALPRALSTGYFFA